MSLPSVEIINGGKVWIGKFVLVEDRLSKKRHLWGDPMADYCKDIIDHFQQKHGVSVRCIGGARMYYKEDSNVIEVVGSSSSYGPLSSKELISFLSENYKGWKLYIYNIIGVKLSEHIL